MCASLSDALTMASALTPVLPSLTSNPNVVILVRALSGAPEGPLVVGPRLPFLTVRPFAAGTFPQAVPLGSTLRVLAPGFSMHGFVLNASGVQSGEAFRFSQGAANLTSLQVLGLNGAGPAIVASSGPAFSALYVNETFRGRITGSVVLHNVTLDCSRPPPALLALSGVFTLLQLSAVRLAQPLATLLVNASGLTASGNVTLAGLSLSGLTGLVLAPPPSAYPAGAATAATTVSLQQCNFTALRCAQSCVGAALDGTSGAAGEAARLSVTVQSCSFTDVVTRTAVLSGGRFASSVADSTFSDITAPLAVLRLHSTAQVAFALTGTTFTDIQGGCLVVGGRIAPVTISGSSFTGTASVAAALVVASEAAASSPAPFFAVSSCTFSNVSSVGAGGGGQSTLAPGRRPQSSTSLTPPSGTFPALAAAGQCMQRC